MERIKKLEEREGRRMEGEEEGGRKKRVGRRDEEERER